MRPDANEPRCRSDASSVYQAAVRPAATRPASVLFPNPGPATRVVRRRSRPVAMARSRAGRATVPFGSRGGASFAARPTARCADAPASRVSPDRAPGSTSPIPLSPLAPVDVAMVAGGTSASEGVGIVRPHAYAVRVTETLAAPAGT